MTGGGSTYYYYNPLGIGEESPSMTPMKKIDEDDALPRIRDYGTLFIYRATKK